MNCHNLCGQYKKAAMLSSFKRSGTVLGRWHIKPKENISLFFEKGAFKMRKRRFTLLFIVCYLIGMLMFPVHAQTAEGTYGDNIKWHFDEATGTLTISGTGVAKGLSEDSVEAYAPYRLDIRHIVIEDGFTEIAKSAFDHFFYLESIWIGDTIKIIGDGAFSNNFNAKRLHLGNGVTTIGVDAFGTMQKLEALVLPPSVQSIGGEAFALSGISQLTIPDGITVINGGTFRASENLSRVTIPASVAEIKYAAFRDCDKLTDVYFTGTQAQWEAINIDYTVDGKGGSNTALLDATIHYNHTHTWDGGKVTNPANCVKKGEKTYTCTVCGGVRIEDIPKLTQHTWDNGTKNADTTVTYQCTTCTAKKTEGTPATEPPATKPPVTEPPATQPPVTQPPATEPPATKPSVTESAPVATEETLAQSGDGGTEATDNTTTEAADEKEPTAPANDEQKTPGSFPWAAVCVGAVVVLAGGGAAIWFWLRNKRSV